MPFLSNSRILASFYIRILALNTPVKDFSQALKEQEIIPSFSRKGCPYDNACIESFHAILKKEEVYHVIYLNFESANIALFQFIEGWYNRRRIHGQLNFQTPQEVE